MDFSVDSLLQIHALHNLMEIKKIQSDTGEEEISTSLNLEPYQSQYNSLEWKYLSTYSSTLLNVMTSYKAVLNKNNTDVEHQHIVESMSQALVDLKPSDISLLLQKLHEECLPRFGVTNLKLAEIQSTHSLLYIVDIWYTKLHKLQKTLQLAIEKLQFFTDNVKSRHQVKPEVWKDIMELVQSVYDCHLSEIRVSSSICRH